MAIPIVVFRFSLMEPTYYHHYSILKGTKIKRYFKLMQISQYIPRNFSFYLRLVECDSDQHDNKLNS